MKGAMRFIGGTIAFFGLGSLIGFGLVLETQSMFLSAILLILSLILVSINEEK